MKSRDVWLEPGVPCELPDIVGERVVERAGGRVRRVSPPATIVEPAASAAKPIYWEDAFGDVCGPAVPELLAKTGPPERFWAIVTYQGRICWVRSDRLRAKPMAHLPVWTRKS